MNPLYAQLLIKGIFERSRKHKGGETEEDFRMARALWEFRGSLRRWLKSLLFMALGVASAAFGLESFLLPNKFIDGGVTGISLLIYELSKFSLPVLLAAINIPFIVLGYKVIGREFAIKTAFAISALSISLYFFHFPEITHDKLLVSVFGGFFLGAGIGLSIRGGAVIDGTEILAIFLSRRMHTSIGDLIILFNIVIFSFAAYLLSVEQALYSMVTYLAASKTLDFVVEGIEEYVGVTIISPRSNVIQLVISKSMGRSVTIYNGKGGYDRGPRIYDMEIIYTIVTRFEVSRLHAEIQKIDPNAVIITSPVKDVKGGHVKRRPLGH